MGIILRIKDSRDRKVYWMDWSTILDRPLSHGCDLKTFKKYYLKQYGYLSAYFELKGRLLRAMKTGCSDRITSLDGVILTNRAGRNEKRLTKEQIIDRFCRRWTEKQKRK